MYVACENESRCKLGYRADYRPHSVTIVAVAIAGHDIEMRSQQMIQMP